MVSCLNAFENTRLSHFLIKIYGNNMSVTRGKKHTYLGMDWDYSVEGKVQVLMTKHIDAAIEDFPEVIERSSPTPHGDNLFRV